MKHPYLTIPIALLGLIWAGCVQMERVIYQDPAFSQYILKFEAVCQVGAQAVSVTFRDLDPVYQEGRCVVPHNPNVKRWINIDPLFWDILSPDGREWLIFHELGHCVLDREHKNSYSGGCPDSIMHQANQGWSQCYREYKEYYYQELCSD